jgi:hypothetical protein
MRAKTPVSASNEIRTQKNRASGGGGAVLVTGQN